MIAGLVIAGHVHLAKVDRAIGPGATNVHSVEKRLSRHLDSQRRNMQPVIDGLLALAFFWLNLRGEDRYQTLRSAFLCHPWRLPKEVAYLFDWLASQISRFLHPRPKIVPLGHFDTG